MSNWKRNVLVAPIVLFVRLPVAIVCRLCEKTIIVLEYAIDRLPGFRR